MTADKPVHPALRRNGTGITADGEFHMPTRVLFGRGVSRQVAEHVDALGGGPVVKMSANVSYGTTAPTHAAFLLAAEQANVPLQYFVNRSGVRGGSTIGPIVAAGLAMPTVDVGNPTLAMHSARELSGTADSQMMIATLQAFLTPA